MSTLIPCARAERAPKPYCTERCTPLAMLTIAALLIVHSVLSPAAAQTLIASAAEPGSSAPRDASVSVLGDVRPFGAGTARTWVQLDAEGNPTSLGITMTEDAFKGLADDITPGLIWAVEYVLAMPADVPMLPFDHVGVNWNPRGHIPNGIYNVPHFDFHFYTISAEDRRAITARGEDLEKCRMAPGPGQMPEGYMFAPESEEPGMGGHWIDPQSHEFHGQGFTHTFLYGSHDGRVIFYEPMITKAFFEMKRDETYPIKTPVSYDRTGYYPTAYGIRYDAQRKEYSVTLEGLTLRNATNPN